VHYELQDVRNVGEFWNELDKQQVDTKPSDETTFVLTANARKLDDALASLPPQLRAQAKVVSERNQAYANTLWMQDPRRFLAAHSMTRLVGVLMRGQPDYF